MWFDLQNRSSWINFANETFSRESVRNIQDHLFKSTASTFFPSQIGLLCGILIAVLVNVKTNKQLQKQLLKLKNINELSLIRISICALVILPLFLAFLLIFLIYRSFVRIILQIKFRGKFRGFLSANDTVWTVEHQKWKSVINILALLEEKRSENFESSLKSSEENAREILEMIRSKFEVLMRSDRSEAAQKIFYCLNRELGYSFWTTAECKIEDYVKFIDIPSSSSFLTTTLVKKWLGEVSNDFLPRNHSFLWEILVCTKPIIENGSIKYPIICRVHHSLGDGVALLRFFLETIADQEKKPSSVALEALRKEYRNNEARVGARSEACNKVCNEACSEACNKACNKDCIEACNNACNAACNKTCNAACKKVCNLACSACIEACSEACNKACNATCKKVCNEVCKACNRAASEPFIPNIRGCINSALKWINLITSIPFYVVQHLSSEPDRSCLHGLNLSGSKRFSWLYESNDSHLLLQLRKLKRTLPAVRLSDLILAALSGSLYRHYERTKTAIPQFIQIVVPARIEPPTKELKLENKFSVAIQKLPILPPLCRNSNFHDLTERVKVVKEETDRVRSRPDYLINYAIMTIFGYLLPYQVLSRTFDSKLATMVFSNLPGPTEEATLKNYKITNLSFSVPHRDSTGIGLTLLTYSGRMQFSLYVDTALIPADDDAQRILQDLENELRLYVEISGS
uniref:O-acyltransferase WSD1 C-terminal domain-containing protein n=1 Tax=Lutzomyia longipalpis TaxID=7200 RepID=A0A1B0FUX8_LUTLO